jgi:hypothetical protein
VPPQVPPRLTLLLSPLIIISSIYSFVLSFPEVVAFSVCWKMAFVDLAFKTSRFIKGSLKSDFGDLQIFFKPIMTQDGRGFGS